MRHVKFKAIALAMALTAGTDTLATGAGAASCAARIQVGYAQSSEFAQKLEFPVTVSAEPGCHSAGSVRYQTIFLNQDVYPAKPDSDYIGMDGQFTWSDTPATGLIPIELVNDLDMEPEERF